MYIYINVYICICIYIYIMYISSMDKHLDHHCWGVPPPVPKHHRATEDAPGDCARRRFTREGLREAAMLREWLK